MSKKLRLAGGIFAIIGISLLNACKDDEPPVRTVTFELAEQEVTESDGTLASFHPDIAEDDGEGRVIQVKLLFDRALAGNAVLRFDVDGTARQNATSSEVNDFEILEEGSSVTIDGDEITIAKGATQATFDILVFEDVMFEYDADALNDDDVPFETVILTLEQVVSGPIKLGAETEHTLKILEDDAVSFLQWEAQDMTPAEAAVDMDILFWVNGEIAWLSAEEGTAFEAVNIPAGIGEGDFGVSYTYYSGNSNDLYFIGVLFNTAGTLNGEKYTYQSSDPLVFEGNYTLANINPWTEEGNTPKIAQTMDKSGINYSNISQISPFDAGSRLRNKPVIKLDHMILSKVSSSSRANSLKLLKRK
jgi:hypothetical protein